MSRLWAFVDRAVEVVIFVVFLAIVIVGTMQVFNRFFLNLSLSWSEELQRYGQIWIVFLGIPVAYRHGVHIGMETLTNRLPPRGQAVFSVIVDILWIVLAVSLILGTATLMKFLHLQSSPGLGLRMDIVYAAIPVGAAYMILIALRRLVATARGGLRAVRQAEVS